MANRKKIAIFLVSINVFLILAMFFARPIAIGYSVYTQMSNLNQSLETYTQNLGELKSNLEVSASNLSSCYEFSQNMLSGLQESNREVLECNDESNILEQENRQLERELSEKSSEASELKNDFDELALNTANNLCCKARVDNPDIKYYRIENNRILCLSEGDLKISCAA